MPQFDTIIQNGTIINGTRQARFRGSVGIRDGNIAAISAGSLPAAEAARVVDATGLVVAPGFVDLHTHYDAQIQWDPYATLSGWHGVTSLVLGNCGFGFAPVRPEERDRAMLTMSRVEAIPFDSMKTGMLWDWVTFPEWLDTLERIPKGVNVLSYVPIGPLMVWVMGLEAAKSRRPTQAEIAEMCRLLELALDAGGCGWSVQRLGDSFTSVQRDYDGTPMVTDIMGDEECLAFAEVLRRKGRGHIQITQAKEDIDEDLAFVGKLAEASGVPILFNAVIVNNYHPNQHRRLLKWIEECQANGKRVYGQTLTAGNDLTYTFEDFNLLDGVDAWREATLGTVDERLAKMRDPEVRAALRHDYDHGRMPITTGPIREFVILETQRPENEKFRGKKIAELGEMTGKHPIEALLDLVTSEKLQTTIFTPPFNTDPAMTRELFDSEYTVPGVSDGGAHTKFLTLGAYTTDFLADLCRDQDLLSLEEAHYRLSALPAQMAGFEDRGLLAEGRPADVIVYDLEQLHSSPPEVVRDFPAGEWRRVKKPQGYRWIFVNGEPTFVDGECTEATPGRLLRHGHA